MNDTKTEQRVEVLEEVVRRLIAALREKDAERDSLLTRELNAVEKLILGRPKG